MSNERYRKGLEIRRDVLDPEYVDKAIAEADDFTRPLQEIVTEVNWGTIWTRPGLERKTRILINLAMLSALNRPYEMKLYLKGALKNGCSKDEIREVFLQVGSYCGWPAAVGAFRAAREVFDDTTAAA